MRRPLQLSSRYALALVRPHRVPRRALTTCATPPSRSPDEVNSGAPPSAATPVHSPTASSAVEYNEPLSLRDVKARIYFPNPLIGLGVRKLAAGKFIRRLGDGEYAVRLEHVQFSPLLEVNARVRVRLGYTAQHTGRVVAGIVTSVNSNGTVSVFLDNNTFMPQLPPSQVYLAESRGRLLTYRGFHELMDWITDAGVVRRAQAEKLATALYYRGWRANTMYRLQKSDLHAFSYVRRSDRLVVVDKAEWQRLHHVEMRGLLRERMKERDWRYFIQKYSGFVSANWAGIGVLSVFMWQLTNYRRHQRSTQLKHAVNTLTRSHGRYVAADDDGTAAVHEAHTAREGAAVAHVGDTRNERGDEADNVLKGANVLARAHLALRRAVLGEERAGTHRRHPVAVTHFDGVHGSAGHRTNAEQSAPYFFVDRPREENWARQILREFDITRPRIAVFTGVRGCGKSALLRRAVDKENKPALFVEVRGKEDALACIMRALRVPNAEACGNYLDFITDVFRKATLINGEPPVLVMTLRDGTELSRLYNEVFTLACDRMLCQVLIEASLESIAAASSPSTVTSASSIKEWALPRLDFYSVPNFTAREAHQYTQHAIDPIVTQHYVEVVGTNAADIDELFAAVRQREVDAVAYINYKLNWAMKQLRIALEQATPPPRLPAPLPSPPPHRHTQNPPTSAPLTTSITTAPQSGSGTTSDRSAFASSPRPAATQTNAVPSSPPSPPLLLSSIATNSAMAEHVLPPRRQRLHTALKRLAAFEYMAGQHAAAQVEDLRDPVLQDIVFYDPIQDRWLFREKVFHTAARSFL